MAIILRCEGQCGKRMGNLEEFRIKGDKYMCLPCAGVAKPAAAIGGTITGRVYKSAMETFLQTAWPMNCSNGNAKHFEKLSGLKREQLPPEQLYWVCLEGNRDDSIKTSSFNLEPSVFNLLLWDPAKSGKFQIVTVDGWRETYEATRPERRRYFGMQLWEIQFKGKF